MDTIISLHLPKTAGSSFRKNLEVHFGDALLMDYADLPLSKSAFERGRDAMALGLQLGEQGLGAGICCVHGHFLPVKYLLCATTKKLFFMTWMRDPLERAISHYYYWQKTYDPSQPTPQHHKRVIEEGWSLERFCLGPEFRNFYAQYLWGFPLEQFDFIGIVEFYRDDLMYFAEKYLHTPLEEYRLNLGEGRRYEVSKEFRRKFEQHHDKDVGLYKRALQIRLERTGL